MRGLYMQLIFVAACGASGPPTATPTQKPLSATDIVARSTPAIVRVEAEGPDGEQFGTGFILDKSGIVATNFHVIQGTKVIRIKLHDGSHHVVEHIVNVDTARDLVLVKFSAEKALPTLRMGDSSKVAAGERIIAIGNPLGVFENTVSEGLISSIRELCPGDDDCGTQLTLLQISAPISQGSSGGPLFNQLGEVVGITAAIIAQGQLINFAIPVNYLKPLIKVPQPVSLDVFADNTRKNITKVPSKPSEPEFAKNGFPPEVFDTCSNNQIADIVKSIGDAIELGAPLFNRGDIEACFRIYEGTAIKLETGSCKGVRDALANVLLKTQTATGFADKAWHMRYTFDGLLKAANKRANNSPRKPN
jgi:serine protease Do